LMMLLPFLTIQPESLVVGEEEEYNITQYFFNFL
jgi:hypothetical protein